MLHDNHAAELSVVTQHDPVLTFCARPGGLNPGFPIPGPGLAGPALPENGAPLPLFAESENEMVLFGLTLPAGPPGPPGALNGIGRETSGSPETLLEAELAVGAAEGRIEKGVEYGVENGVLL
jgi:hypothetical protein